MEPGPGSLFLSLFLWLIRILRRSRVANKCVLEKLKMLTALSGACSAY